MIGAQEAPGGSSLAWKVEEYGSLDRRDEASIALDRLVLSHITICKADSS
jgi:hypothetical protein